MAAEVDTRKKRIFLDVNPCFAYDVIKMRPCGVAYWRKSPAIRSFPPPRETLRNDIPQKQNLRQG
jgi:hypothetical protein